MKRFALLSIWLFIAFVLSLSVHAAESDNDSALSSSSFMLEEMQSTGQDNLRRNAENVPDIEGRWLVEWHDYPEEGQIKRAALMLTKPWEVKREKMESGASRWVCRRNNEGDWSLEGWHGENYDDGYGRRRPEVSAEGGITIKHPNFFLGWWGGTSTVRQAGPNEIRGQWSYRDNGGAEIWHKVLLKITRIKFISEIEDEVAYGTVPGRVEDTYGGFIWKDGNSMRGNRPRFEIEIYGENLWGDHAIDLCGAEGLEPLKYSYIKDSESNLPGGVVGIKFTVIIWPHFKLGRKTLFIDGIEIPFDFIVKEEPELSFVTKVEDAYREIEDELEFYGEPLFLESRYELEYEEDIKTSILEWYSDDDTLLGSAEFILIRTEEDPFLYRSEAFYIMPPPIPDGWLQITTDEEQETLSEPDIEL